MDSAAAVLHHHHHFVLVNLFSRTVFTPALARYRSMSSVLFNPYVARDESRDSCARIFSRQKLRNCNHNHNYVPQKRLSS